MPKPSRTPPPAGAAPLPSREGTRAALLDAATAVFVEQGYDLARVRDIAERAGANVAAINYHFGGKEALYLEVLRHQAGERIERYPFADAAQLAGAEQALRAAVTALLSRFLAEDQRAFVAKLLMRELLSPTPALRTLVADVIAPQFRQLSAIVARLLGPKADTETVTRCTLSIVSQCMFYLFARPLVEQLAPHSYDSGGPALLATHIAQFSLAALQARRRDLEAGDA
ncbi:CerR family C-terminal domain-containing protein [Solimonas soli]|uniref:CerR family C-terminal domain-containing protein n=1 Tax=Solimonas soli TaxID=413479 RepID=UPI000A03C516|nr:CerR family C-terminal domain-containing protein [Solimonas soli]